MERRRTHLSHSWICMSSCTFVLVQDLVAEDLKELDEHDAITEVAFQVSNGHEAFGEIVVHPCCEGLVAAVSITFIK